ncbi:MAG: M4 family metallopeptidase [Chloroflexota bacterium]|nr:M4 family metallopeptidase [Chloroflexota bacterium]
MGYVFLTLKPSGARQGKSVTGPWIYGELSDEQHIAIEQLSKQSARNLDLQEKGGTIRALLLNVDMGYANDPERQVQAFMQEYQNLYQINDFSKEFRLTDYQIDDDNSVVLKYSQWVDSIPVYSSQLLVDLDRLGNIRLVSGGYLPEKDLYYDPNITYSKTEIKNVLNDQGYAVISSDESIELVLYNAIVLGHEKGETTLAWTMEVVFEGEPFHAVVSAKTAEVFILAREIIFYNYNLYDAEKYPILNLKGESEEIVDECHIFWQWIKPIYALNEKYETDYVNKINYLITIIDRTLSIYENHLGWKGYNNHDHHFEVLINVDAGSPFHWYRCVSVLIGFNDDASIYSAEDIFPHEFQHAVTSQRVILEQSAETAEAGALNEAYSDIFTALIDTENPWQLTQGQVLIRDMENPSKVKGHPSHYKDFRKPTKKNDFCHENSTIISHAAYLIAEGGKKQGIHVDGLGIGDMTKIFFNSQNHLRVNANFFQARAAVITACEYYYPDDTARCDSVHNAFAIVGIGDPVPQPSLWDEVIEILNSLQDSIVDARVKLMLDLFKKLTELNIQIDDFFLRMEQDLVNLMVELALKMATAFLESLFSSIFDQVCGSYLFALVLPGTAFFLIRKYSSRI